MALFVLLLVGVVVAQTWFDWRDTNKARVVPEWAKGMALGGLIAVPLAAAAAVFSIWIREDPAIAAGAFGSHISWPAIAFLLFAMTILVLAVRKKGLRFMLLLAGVVVAAFWLGLSL
ncbi:MAG TPA: hypothetical protein VN885_00670 [Candidatus Acidoferrales bacterium]|nr:hypothetical protein [Candidatus Acidoferrales bacterium]